MRPSNDLVHAQKRRRTDQRSRQSTFLPNTPQPPPLQSFAAAAAPYHASVATSPPSRIPPSQSSSAQTSTPSTHLPTNRQSLSFSGQSPAMHSSPPFSSPDPSILTYSSHPNSALLNAILPGSNPSRPLPLQFHPPPPPHDQPFNQLNGHLVPSPLSIPPNPLPPLSFSGAPALQQPSGTATSMGMTMGMAVGTVPGSGAKPGAGVSARAATGATAGQGAGIRQDGQAGQGATMQRHPFDVFSYLDASFGLPPLQPQQPHGPQIPPGPFTAYQTENSHSAANARNANSVSFPLRQPASTAMQQSPNPVHAPSGPVPSMAQALAGTPGAMRLHQPNGAPMQNDRFNSPSILPSRPGIVPNRGPPRSVSLKMISPLRKALELFRDGSPILVALENTVMQSTNVNVPHSIQRDRILSFTGFPPNIMPKYNWLLSLNKNDLEILAWVFVVSKHGRKEEVARRIVTSLYAPLRYRTPPQKRPGIPTRIVDRSTNSWNAPQARGATTQSHSSRIQRGNMPTLTVPPTMLSPQGESIVSNLRRELAPTNALPRMTSASSVNRAAAQQCRSKLVRSLCAEVLPGYSFDAPENPFNIPLNPPLSTDAYVVFSSVQLSRGTPDPTLRFLTPAPIDKNTRPEVRGGDVQVQLRCLRVEVEKPKSEWKQAWPFPVTCRVNGHGITLNQAQRYTNGKLAGRDSATNISQFLRKYKKSGLDANKVVLRRQLTNATPATGQYVLFAQEVLVMSHETMTKSVVENSEKYWVEHRANLEKKGSLSPTASEFEMARQGVMQFLTDPDGLTVSSMKVSLRCPLALTRIATPVKGRRCQHVQCFDLESFLEYARRSSKFDCPVCNKNTAYPSMLVISPYIEHALERFKDCDEVELNQDGTMVEVERERTGVASDNDDDNELKSEQKTMAPKSSPAAKGSSSDVVDLTLDSDDESPEQSGSANAGKSTQGSGDPTSTDGAGGNIERSHTDAMNAEAGRDAGLDQDINFSFRSDLYDWIDSQVRHGCNDVGNRTLRTEQAEPSGDNWGCDVIAIDSD